VEVVVDDVEVVAVVGGKVCEVGRREWYRVSVVGTVVVAESDSRGADPHPASSASATPNAPRRRRRDGDGMVLTRAEV
jgi:hypothetical protein